MAKQPDKNLKQRIIGRYEGNAATQFREAVGFEKTIIIAPAITYAFNKAVQDNNFDRNHDKVIDIGCGPFLLAMPLLRDGIHVDGVDITPDMIGQAQKTLNQTRIHPRIDRAAIELVTDYAELTPKSYKFAMLNFVHQCCDTRESLVDLFKQASDLLKPGGRLIMISTHPDYLHVPHAAYACDVKDDQNLSDGEVYTGEIFGDYGRAAFKIEDDHYWSDYSVKEAAEEAGLRVKRIEDIEDNSSMSRLKSDVPAYLMYTFSKPLAPAL